MTDNKDDVKIKVVKLIVLVFTLMIFVGAGFLIYLIATKKNIKQNLEMPTIATSSPTSYKVNLNQPLGSKIESFKPGNGYLYVEVSEGGLPPRILSVDLNSGKVTSTIILSTNE